uniref:plastocyanin/azurin family copper-binding protein n=1 Tax=Pandoraea sputorum TaxID=93222 RepID=UPI003556C4A5
MHRALLLTLTLALPGFAWAADDCSTEIHGTDQMTFYKNEIVVPASCKSFKVVLQDSGNLPKEVMGHNWLLSDSSNMQAIVHDGAAAGVAHDYLKPHDARII